MIEEVAPAKVNLFLHVGPVRHDGLHEIFSLFVFTDDGDRLIVAGAKDLSLHVTGEFAGGLVDAPPEKNLVWRAATLLRETAGTSVGAAITLEKRLPIAAGVGGGSSDAAAVLRALIRLWNVEMSHSRLQELAFELGADVPACLDRLPVLVSGAGEKIVEGPGLPALWVCLVNPRVETLTGQVFRAFDEANPKPPMPLQSMRKSYADSEAISGLFLSTQNDLEPFAAALTPAITDILKHLKESAGALCARMSGSGATCFSLYPTRSDAESAANSATKNGWWSMAAAVTTRTTDSQSSGT